jgi:uncharacterized protein (DUF1684 family)
VKRFAWLAGGPLLLAAFVTAGAASNPAASPYEESLQAARAARVTQLQAPDGWLTLIGLHFLRDGPNRVGRAPDNDVVLANGPAHIGVVTLADGKVKFALAEGVDAKIGDGAARDAELRIGEGATKPTLVTAGTLSFFVIERGGRKALRVKDSASPRRTHFLGLDYFAIDPAWRVEAEWVPFASSRLIPITNILGQTAPEPVPGKAVFQRDGKTFELLAIDEGPDEPLFFVFSDATSGRESYGACRFLYVERPKSGRIVLDFNRAENPPCAFTPFATCPLPPKENRLPFAVRAGEMNYRGGHE